MKKLMLLGISVLWLSIPAIPAGAQVNVQVGIKLPPLIVFSSPPVVVVLPDTYVYVVPDIDEDFFFYDGWWWRPWNGHWYRSQHYDRDWVYYSSVPNFYREVPPGWRHEYKAHEWRGQPWQYERMPHQKVEKNWNNWKKDKYWEKQKTWGVQGYKPPPPKHGQQPQGHQQSSQQPNKGQPYQGHGNQEHVQGNQGHAQGNQVKGQGSQGHVQGNQGEGHGNKGVEQHGGKKGK